MLSSLQIYSLEQTNARKRYKSKTPLKETELNLITLHYADTFALLH